LLTHRAPNPTPSPRRQGPAFDTDARRAQGPVLQWIDRLLRAPHGHAPPPAAGRLALLRTDGGDGKHSGGGAPPRAHVARVALGHLLRYNLDMFSVCVDRCYHPDGSIATGYFQVGRSGTGATGLRGRAPPAAAALTRPRLPQRTPPQVVSEVYALHVVPCEPTVILSLVLYKMVDPGAEVRGASLFAAGGLFGLPWMLTPPPRRTLSRALAAPVLLLPPGA
jgi:hypothetical protein